MKILHGIVLQDSPKAYTTCLDFCLAGHPQSFIAMYSVFNKAKTKKQPPRDGRFASSNNFAVLLFPGHDYSNRECRNLVCLGLNANDSSEETGKGKLVI